MTKFLITLLIVTCGNQLSAQSYLLPYRTGNLWGYVDLNLNTVIQPKYDSVSFDSYHDRWTIYSNGKTGQMNEFGNVIIPPIYDEIKQDAQYSELHYNYLIKDEKIGYANMDGKVIIPPKYDNLHLIDYPFQHDQWDLRQFNFFIKKEGVYSIIDHSGAIVLEKIDKLKNKSDGKYLFRIDQKWGLYFIGYKHWIIPCEYDSLSELPDRSRKIGDRSRRMYYYYAELDKQKYFIDKDINPIPATQHMIDSAFPKEEEITAFDMDMDVPVVAPERINNAKGYQSITEHADPATGKLEIHSTYRRREESINKISITHENGKVGALIERKDEWDKVLPPEYDDLLLLRNRNGSLANQLLMLKKNGKFGLFDMRNYKIVSKPIYDSIVPSHRDDIFLIYLNGKLGLIEYNKEITKIPYLFIPPSFDTFEGLEFIDSIGDPYKSKALYLFINNGQKCLVDWNGNPLFDD